MERFKEKGFKQADAYVAAGYLEDGRNYKQAAKILKDLNVNSIILLANSSNKADALRKENIVVSGTKELKLENEDLAKSFEEKVRKHY